MVKNKSLYRFLACCFGWLGLHRFYRNQFGLGLAYLFSFGLLTIGWIVDAINAFIHDDIYLDNTKIDDKETSTTSNQKEENTKQLNDPFFNIKGILRGKFYNESKFMDSRYDKYYLSDNFIDIIKSVDKNSDYDLYISVSCKNCYSGKSDFVDFNSCSPSFVNITENQLTYYFYWRMKFLNGEYVATNKSYVLLFVRELVNYGFTQDLQVILSILDKLSLKYNYIGIAFNDVKEDILIENGYLSQSKIVVVRDRLYTYLEKEQDRYSLLGVIFDKLMKDRDYDDNVDLVLNDNSIKETFIDNFTGYVNYNRNAILVNWFDIETTRHMDNIFKGIPLDFKRKQVEVIEKHIVPSETYKKDILKLIESSIIKKDDIIKQGNFYKENTSFKYNGIVIPEYIKNQLVCYDSKNETYDLSKFSLSLSLKYNHSYVEECDYVQYNALNPKFYTISEEQLEYYLYWRKELLNNNYIDNGDYAYLQLFLYELANYGFSQNVPFILTTLDYIEERCPLYLKSTVVEIKNALLYEAGVKDYVIIKEDINTLNSYLRHYYLENIDYWLSDIELPDSYAYMIDKVTRYSKNKEMFELYLNKLIGYYKEKEIDLNDYWLDKSIKITECKLLDTIPGRLCRKKAIVKNISFSKNSIMKEQMKGLVFLATKHFKEAYNSGLPKDFFEKYEINCDFIETSYDFYIADDIIDEKYRGYSCPSEFIEILDTFKDKDTSDQYFDINKSLSLRNSYVPYKNYYEFTRLESCFDKMSDNQLQYYLYWRKELLNGRYVKTTESYMRLFVYELLNYSFTTNLPLILTLLDRIKENYETEHSRWKIFETIKLVKKDLIYEVSDNKQILNITVEDEIYKTIKNCVSITSKPESMWLDDRLEKLSNSDELFVGVDKCHGKKIVYGMRDLVKFYEAKNINVQKLWFAKKNYIDKYKIFNGLPTSFERITGKCNYEKFVRKDKFYSDVLDVVVIVNHERCTNSIKLKNAKKLKLPAEFIENKLDITLQNKTNVKSIRKTSESKSNDYDVEYKKLTLDNSKIDQVSKIIPTKQYFDTSSINQNVDKSKYDIDYVELDVKKNSDIKLSIEEVDKEFLNMFIDNSIAKDKARKYCLKKGKMVKAYISDINSRYYDKINRELIIENENCYELSFDIGGELND